MGLSYMSFGQSIQLLNKGTKTSIRGLSVVDDQTTFGSAAAGHSGPFNRWGPELELDDRQRDLKNGIPRHQAFDDKRP